jgi:hypothetical protein
MGGQGKGMGGLVSLLDRERKKKGGGPLYVGLALQDTT